MKKCVSKKRLKKKIKGKMRPKKFWAPKSFESIKSLVQLKFGLKKSFKKYLVKKEIWSKKMGPRNFNYKILGNKTKVIGPTNFLIQEIFGSKDVW